MNRTQYHDCKTSGHLNREVRPCRAGLEEGVVCDGVSDVPNGMHGTETCDEWEKDGVNAAKGKGHAF